MQHALTTVAIIMSMAGSAIATAQSQTDLTDLIKQSQGSQKSDLTEAGAQRMADEFLSGLKAEKLEKQTETPRDVFSSKQAFPADLFDFTHNLEAQTGWLIQQAEKGKRVSAVYDMESAYREDLARLGEKVSHAARITYRTDPETGEAYAQISRNILGATMISVGADDIKKQSEWLRKVGTSLEQVAVLRKKPAR